MRSAPSSAYLICGTPRTGSSLLCSLLQSTGVAGRPESYFREPDERMWAQRFGVPLDAGGSYDYDAFVAAAVRAGTTPNDVFGARVMWGTLGHVVRRLDPGRRRGSDLDVLVSAFGPLRFVHLHRADVLAQAVSWARAEQTGRWQDDDYAAARPRFDRAQIDGFVRTIGRHNAAWMRWFGQQAVEPVVLTYEELVTAPAPTVMRVLQHLEVTPPADWRPVLRHRRQADELNADWIRRYLDGQPALRPLVDGSLAATEDATRGPDGADDSS
jgi:trehalose 2-sulfotransferase